MGNVYDDAELVHLFQCLKAERFQAAACMLIRIRTVRIADAVFIVPGQRHHADTVCVNRVQAFKLLVQFDAVLYSENRGEKTTAGILQNLGGRESGAEDIRTVGEKLSVAGEQRLIKAPGVGFPAEVFDGGIMGGDEEGKALG